MKRVWILIVLIMLIFTIYEVAISYAKYTSEATATTDREVGAWVVKVNQTDIATANATTSFTINSLTYTSTQYVKPGKMAPSSSGYFDIIIDPSDCSVAIRYDATLNFSALNISDAINFDSIYKVVNNVETTTGIIRTGENTYSGIISLSDVINEVPTELRFYVTWEEDGTGTNDAADSILGMGSSTILNIPVNIVVSQYTGEQITAYVTQ